MTTLSPRAGNALPKPAALDVRGTHAFMPPSRLHQLLDRFPAARVAVLGDFCIDVYYEVDLAAAETSLETGLATRPVRRQSISLGGAGNVAANLRALGVGTVSTFGIVGSDPFGRELRHQLEVTGIQTGGLITQSAGWETHAYVKPLLGRDEDHRIDLGAFNALDEAAGRSLLAALAAALPQHEVLIVNQQFSHGLYTAAMQGALTDLFARHPDVIVLQDSRGLGRLGTACLRKMNALEAVRLSFGPRELGSQVAGPEARQAAVRQYEEHHRPVFVTCGERGCIVVDASGVHEIPGVHIEPPTDPVGAGDAMLAGIAACLAVKGAPVEAATIGNFAAAVTVRKLRQTGTASAAEVLTLGETPDYVHHPDLADGSGGEIVPGTEIEVVEPYPLENAIRCAVFDHDGTLSTLRQGWERVMEDMMTQAVLGPAEAKVDRATRERLVEDIRNHIGQTTGLPTLRQMEGLVQRVEQAGFVPRAEVLPAAAYKEAYIAALRARLERRRARLAAGELEPADFTVKGAIAFLHRLHAAGVMLCLASGTDEQEVVLEARALGYAHLFGGRIYGARPDGRYNAKHAVLDGLLSSAEAFCPAEIVVFGDGPAELREARRRGILAVGVASDEVQRFGLNPEKRSRLIRAGAHVIIPDYAQADTLLSLLGLAAVGLSPYP